MRQAEDGEWDRSAPWVYETAAPAWVSELAAEPVDPRRLRRGIELDPEDQYYPSEDDFDDDLPSSDDGYITPFTSPFDASRQDRTRYDRPGYAGPRPVRDGERLPRATTPTDQGRWDSPFSAEPSPAIGSATPVTDDELASRRRRRAQPGSTDSDDRGWQQDPDPYRRDVPDPIADLYRPAGRRPADPDRRDDVDRFDFDRRRDQQRGDQHRYDQSSHDQSSHGQSSRGSIPRGQTPADPPATGRARVPQPRPATARAADPLSDDLLLGDLHPDDLHPGPASPSGARRNPWVDDDLDRPDDDGPGWGGANGWTTDDARVPRTRADDDGARETRRPPIVAQAGPPVVDDPAAPRVISTATPPTTPRVLSRATPPAAPRVIARAAQTATPRVISAAPTTAAPKAATPAPSAAPSAPSAPSVVAPANRPTRPAQDRSDQNRPGQDGPVADQPARVQADPAIGHARVIPLRRRATEPDDVRSGNRPAGGPTADAATSEGNPAVEAVAPSSTPPAADSPVRDVDPPATGAPAIGTATAPTSGAPTSGAPTSGAPTPAAPSGGDALRDVIAPEDLLPTALMPGPEPTERQAPTPPAPAVRTASSIPEEEATEEPDAVQQPAEPPAELALATIRWRLDGATLREVVDDRDDLRALGARLDQPLTESADNLSRARLLCLRAEVYRLLDELGMAAAASRLALAHAEAADDAQAIVVAQAELAHVLRLRRDFGEADRLFEEAACAEVPELVRCVVHENAGRSSFDQGRYMEALDHFARAIRLGDPGDLDLVERIDVALEAVYIRVLRDGWGPYPRLRREILGITPEEPDAPQLHHHESQLPAQRPAQAQGPTAPGPAEQAVVPLQPGPERAADAAPIAIPASLPAAAPAVPAALPDPAPATPRPSEVRVPQQPRPSRPAAATPDDPAVTAEREPIEARAQPVSAQAVSAQAVSAQAVSAQAVSAQVGPTAPGFRADAPPPGRPAALPQPRLAGPVQRLPQRIASPPSPHQVTVARAHPLPHQAHAPQVTQESAIQWVELELREAPQTSRAAEVDWFTPVHDPIPEPATPHHGPDIGRASVPHRSADTG
jgi:hypothetical protein